MKPRMVASAMGVVSAALSLFSRDAKRKEALNLLVDTGSTYTWVPEGIARALDLRPAETWRFRTVDGRVIERRICDALVECQGRRGIVRIVFAKKSDSQVLGVTALEVLGLEVDPRSGTLRKARASLAV